MPTVLVQRRNKVPTNLSKTLCAPGSAQKSLGAKEGGWTLTPGSRFSSACGTRRQEINQDQCYHLGLRFSGHRKESGTSLSSSLLLINFATGFFAFPLYIGVRMRCRVELARVASHCAHRLI